MSSTAVIDEKRERERQQGNILIRKVSNKMKRQDSTLGVDFYFLTDRVRKK